MFFIVEMSLNLLHLIVELFNEISTDNICPTDCYENEITSWSTVSLSYQAPDINTREAI